MLLRVQPDGWLCALCVLECWRREGSPFKQRAPWAGECVCVLLFGQQSVAVGQSFVSKGRRDENVLQHPSQASVCTRLSEGILAAIAVAQHHSNPCAPPRPSAAQCVQAPERLLSRLPLQRCHCNCKAPSRPACPSPPTSPCRRLSDGEVAELDKVSGKIPVALGGGAPFENW